MYNISGNTAKKHLAYSIPVKLAYVSFNGIAQMRFIDNLLLVKFLLQQSHLGFHIIQFIQYHSVLHDKHVYSLDIFLSFSRILTRRTDMFFALTPTISPISS